MVVKQTHLIAFLIVLAVAAGYFIQNKTNAAERKKQQTADVALCASSVTRASYIANGFEQLSIRVVKRAEKGDFRAAKDYAAVASSVRSTFPSTDAEKDSRVERVEESDGTVRFALSAASTKLIETGCWQLFK